MRNARAAWRDQLRNQVRAGQPDLGDAEVETAVDELVRAARSAGGRKGAALARRSALAAQNVLENHREVARMARELVDALERLGDPTAGCMHAWTLEFDYCQLCGADAAVAA
jgi:hypothetical protein